MSDSQGDLFSWAEAATPSVPATDGPVRALSDGALVAAIPLAGVLSYAGLVAEAVRRQLPTAIPALAALCRRFAGYGRDRVVREQAAALNALAAIGGPVAAEEVGRLLEQNIVEGPGLAGAVHAAALLGSKVSSGVLAPLLAHASPAIRADACRCARDVSLLALLSARLDDPDRRVRNAAACALGRLGSSIALPGLNEILRTAPTLEAIEAAAMVADETCMVLLGRVAREVPRLAAAALEALDSLDDPRSARIAAAARRTTSP